jgi:hypothetical protein
VAAITPHTRSTPLACLMMAASGLAFAAEYEANSAKFALGHHCGAGAPLLLVGYSDGVQKPSHGQRSLHPIYLSFANLPRDLARQERNSIHVGSIPVFKAPAGPEAAERFKLALQRMKYKCWAYVMEALEELEEEGLIILAGTKNKNRVVRPRLLLMTGDNPEAQMFCACSTAPTGPRP